MKRSHTHRDAVAERDLDGLSIRYASPTTVEVDGEAIRFVGSNRLGRWLPCPATLPPFEPDRYRVAVKATSDGDVNAGQVLVEMGRTGEVRF